METMGYRDVLRQTRTLFEGGAVAGLSDRELLDRYASRGGEAGESAFAAIVARHGPTVLRVGRAILGDEHEAHDAFQATFLVLARKAGSVRVGDSLAPWLHEVARRVAANARSASARRGRHERIAAEQSGRSEPNPPADDLAPALHEEVGRLPERFRAAVLLCDLGGLTQEQAAEQLGCPLGTVRSRLARARERLRGRLTRRGLAPSLVPATLPALSDASIEATAKLASGGRVPLSVDMLTEGGLRAMRWIKWKAAVAAVVAVGMVAVGGSMVARRAIGDDPPAKKARARPSPVAPEDDAPTSPAVAVVASPSGSKVWAYSPKTKAWQTYKSPDGVKATPGVYPGLPGRGQPQFLNEETEIEPLSFSGEEIKEIAVFHAGTGAWVRQALKAPARGDFGAFAGNRFAIYRVGRTLYGFSAATGRWAVRDLPEDKFAIDVKPGDPIPEDLLPHSSNGQDGMMGGMGGGGTINIGGFAYSFDPAAKAWRTMGFGGGMMRGGGMGHGMVHFNGLPFGDLPVYTGDTMGLIRVGRFICGFGVRTGTWDVLDLGEDREDRLLRNYPVNGEMILFARGERLFTFNPRMAKFEDIEAGAKP